MIRLVSMVALVCSLFAVAAQAAAVHFYPTNTQVLNHDFTPIDPSLIRSDGQLRPREESYLLYTEVRFKTFDTVQFAGLARTGFDISIKGDGQPYGMKDLGLYPWLANNPMSGGFPPRLEEIWLTNRDGGPIDDDLQTIELTSSVERRALSDGTDRDIIGYSIIELPGTASSTTSAEIQTPYATTFWKLQGNAQVGESTGGPLLEWRVVPEPGALLLAVIGGLVASSIRWRRTA